jgi:ADP-ribose pyrophosphatase
LAKASPGSAAVGRSQAGLITKKRKDIQGIEKYVNALPIRLNRTVIYESPWVNLYRDRVALPTGRILEQYHLLDFGRGAVAVVVEDKQGRILMEQVARYPTGMVSWELPAGRIEADEPILEAARREVLEETGYETSEHRQVYTYHPLNGISNMTVYVVHCRAGVGSGQLDHNEVGQIAWFTPVELKRMIGRGEISDGFALVGLLLHYNPD